MIYDVMFEVMMNRGFVEEVIKWYKEFGGIVIFCWYWFFLIGGSDKIFYIKNIDFDIEVVFCFNIKENKLLMEDIYEIGKWLKIMVDVDVFVIFRFFYEVDGRWFWWGVKGFEVYKRFYYFLYDVYINCFKLNNFIWVWNVLYFDWRIEKDYYDVVGVDFYVLF